MSDSRYSASQVLAAALTTALAALAPLTSQAQSNAPLTGGMTSSPPAAASTQVAQPVSTATPAAQPAAPAEEAFGDVTRGLLAAQADGRRAGAMLPVLGPVSTAAWNRYLESFSHPIPEYLQKRVETKNTN
ncbi:hypothetical protein D3C86_579790 [compost metagenome]